MAVSNANSRLGKRSYYYDEISEDCEPCHVQGKRLKADRFCVECQEYLCRKCSAHHAALKATRSHGLVTVDNAKKAKPGKSKDQCSYTCNVHKFKSIKYFCVTHSYLGCSVCITINHKQCKNIDYIPTVAEDIRNLDGFKKFDEHLKSLETSCKTSIADVQNNVKQVGKDKRQLEEAIKEFRQNINLALNKLENEITTQAEQIHIEEIIRLNALLKNITSSLSSVDTLQNQVGNLLSHGKHCDTYVIMKKAESQLVALNNELLNTTKGKTYRRYEFQPNNDILKTRSLGKLRVRLEKVSSNSDITETEPCSNDPAEVTAIKPEPCTDDPANMTSIKSEPCSDAPAEVTAVDPEPYTDDQAEMTSIKPEPCSDDPDELTSIEPEICTDDPAEMTSIKSEPCSDDDAEMTSIKSESCIDDPALVTAIEPEPCTDEPADMTSLKSEPCSDNDAEVTSITSESCIDDPAVVTAIEPDPCTVDHAEMTSIKSEPCSDDDADVTSITSESCSDDPAETAIEPDPCTVDHAEMTSIKSEPCSDDADVTSITSEPCSNDGAEVTSITSEPCSDDDAEVTSITSEPCSDEPAEVSIEPESCTDEPADMTSITSEPGSDDSAEVTETESSSCSNDSAKMTATHSRSCIDDSDNVTLATVSRPCTVGRASSKHIQPGTRVRDKDNYKSDIYGTVVRYDGSRGGYKVKWDIGVTGYHMRPFLEIVET